jgi:hypothetical protein
MTVNNAAEGRKALVGPESDLAAVAAHRPPSDVERFALRAWEHRCGGGGAGGALPAIITHGLCSGFDRRGCESVGRREGRVSSLASDSIRGRATSFEGQTRVAAVRRATPEPSGRAVEDFLTSKRDYGGRWRGLEPWPILSRCRSNHSGRAPVVPCRRPAM